MALTQITRTTALGTDMTPVDSAPTLTHPKVTRPEYVDSHLPRPHTKPVQARSMADSDERQGRERSRTTRTADMPAMPCDASRDANWSPLQQRKQVQRDLLRAESQVEGTGTLVDSLPRVIMRVTRVPANVIAEPAQQGPQRTMYMAPGGDCAAPWYAAMNPEAGHRSHATRCAGRRALGAKSAC